MTSRTVVLGLGSLALIAGCGATSSGGTATPPSSAAPATSPSPTPTPTHTHASVTPTVTVTATKTAPVAAGPCPSSHLALTLGIGQGTAGTTYQVLVLTNTGSSSCTLFGYPGVSFVNSSGAIIGKPATRDPGAEHTITLAPGGAANALSRQPDAGNFPPSVCHMKTADRVKVYPPNQTVPLFAHDAIQVCSTAKGRTGIGPMLADNGG
jgi:hypothetical protein